MSMNMGYCRFENTLLALKECENHLYEKLSESEERAKIELIALCQSIAEEASEEPIESEDQLAASEGWDLQVTTHTYLGIDTDDGEMLIALDGLV
jgi:hypothetical protein